MPEDKPKYKVKEGYIQFSVTLPEVLAMRLGDIAASHKQSRNKLIMDVLLEKTGLTEIVNPGITDEEWK